MIKIGSVRLTAEQRQTKAVHQVLGFLLNGYFGLRYDGHCFQMPPGCQQAPIGNDHGQITGDMLIAALKFAHLITGFHGLGLFFLHRGGNFSRKGRRR